ncbi:tyrosine-protein phosphatase [Nonomuraea spiralis]|uniref:Tyrosine-protein phosphatase n=1 Tax=Nonomuraea spiralis TaxID=46182 RepID=A0ABV5IU23_9ACTN|nr:MULTISPECIES: tyrosine-protein phosphatase [Nonomuraea]RSN04955.1 protein-tyrosine-phosphatase [Nonomuraea sp. WAC 01424]GGS91725.1 protein-tyrosine-phosphatase [Nonomuraea spiralis]
MSVVDAGESGSRQDRTRVLEWPGCANVRDLGGLPTADGGRIRWGALVRGDRPRAESVPALLTHGVRLVADLRLATECLADPPPPVPGRRHLPVLRDEDTVLEALGDTLPAIYRVILDRGAHRFAAVLSAIAHAPPGGVLLHCHSGKDRTGLAVALALSLAGVAHDDVAADYAVTAACLRLDDHLADLREEDVRDRSRRLFAQITAGTMLAALAHLDARHGGAEAYLLAGGLPPADADLLRARLTDR